MVTEQWILIRTGLDPKPYFQRLFNPWLQGEKFDKQTRYIKKWLPQLKDVPSNELHKWDEYYKSYSIYLILTMLLPLLIIRKRENEASNNIVLFYNL